MNSTSCNYFYLIEYCVTPLRQRIQFLFDGGFIAEPLYLDMLNHINTISNTIEFYSSAVKKGLGEL